MILGVQLDPITRKRFRRFREFRRAWWSFWILAAAYALSLGSEFICNSRPLWVKMDDRVFVPVLFDYTEDALLGNGINTRPDYKAIRAQRPDARMVFPFIAYGPLEILKAESIELPETVTVNVAPDPRVASVDVREDLTIARSAVAGFFFGTDDTLIAGRSLTDLGALPDRMRAAIRDRFENRESAAVSARVASGEISLPPFSPRSQPPKTVRLTLREQIPDAADVRTYTFGKDADIAKDGGLDPAIAAAAQRRFEGEVEPMSVMLEGQPYRVTFAKEDVRFPLKPVPGHPLGIDRAGRDVSARILYGLRTSITFGLVLVSCSMFVGTLIGAWQGFHGGWRDILGQRLIEIWESLPFLYIVMLLGSVLGRSLLLLTVCYGVFNWIGISYYMRAEFLRLRRQPFVEAARCMGLSKGAIIFRHILPNALVPIITFAPFSLVGAVGSLAALDFLGFGLPPPTPSWGEMLSQAQDFPWAWWLVLYPSLALFLVMLLCVFIGEGVRAAFDPRKFARMQ
ncbi:MAG: ABC transporter permease subunit [bacterium]